MKSKETILGLDLGTVTCGVASSDELQWFAHPVKTIRHDGDIELLIQDLTEIIEKNNTSTIVLGLPKMLNGDIGERAQASIDFKETLIEVFHLPVVLIDERFTTASAQRSLISADVSRKKRKQVIDQLAAVNILQTYLDQNKR